MKLLLTSAGIANSSIAKALFEMVGKKGEDTSLVFIPTASNVEMGDKNWLIDDLVSLQKLNLKTIEIADISAVPQDIWEPKFEAADVLFFEGGNTFYLMEWMNRSDLISVLPKYLETKVYVGVSAGSMVVCKDLALRQSQTLYDEDLEKTENIAGLNLVDFYVLPHLNSNYFTKLREETIRQATSGMSETVYALDDQSAVKIDEGGIEIISEGKWFCINGDEGKGTKI